MTDLRLVTALREYRLGRVRQQLIDNDMAGIVLFDPVNIRYASGSSNMQVWTLHNPSRYAYVPAEVTWFYLIFRVRNTLSKA